MKRPKKESYPLKVRGSDGKDHVLAYNMAEYSKAQDEYIDWLVGEHNHLVDGYNHLKENQAC